MTKLVGTAVTVLLRSEPDPDRASLAVYTQALEGVGAGDVFAPVMVIEVPEAHHHQGIFGEGAATSAKGSGFVGALVDGAVRDTRELTDMGFPLFSRATAPGYIVGKVTALSCGNPVRIGGVTVAAGDIVFGDNDGVTVIQPPALIDVIDRATAIAHWEREVHRLIAAGFSSEDAIARVGDMP